MGEDIARSNREWEERMFQGGSMLEYCEALRGSSTGMSDPLRDEEVRDIRTYLSLRLGRWREPTSDWDGLVRAIVEHSLRCYHTPAGLELNGRPSWKESGWSAAEEARSAKEQSDEQG